MEWREQKSELSPYEGYARWAEQYDTDGNPLIALEGPAVANLLGDLSGKRVLDLGCGTGRHTIVLCQKGGLVTALDQSIEMIQIAQKKLQDYNIHWVIHPLPDSLPFPDNFFSSIVAGLVAEHIQDLETLFREVSRILLRGGQFVLSALHPERTLAGQRARFIDPQTGLRVPIVTYHRSREEYCHFARINHLNLRNEQTLIVDDPLADRLPRAEKYRGLALGWVAEWVK